MHCEWCGDRHNIVGPGGLSYCSDQCEYAAFVYGFERMDAILEDADPPTKQDIDRRIRRSDRWTPEKMQERIEDIKRL